LFSLIGQTAGIARDKINGASGTVVQHGKKQYDIFQQKVCADFWSHLLHRSEGSCWTMVPTSTIPEKLFCGRIDDFSVCTTDVQKQQLIPGASATAAAAAAAKREKRKDLIFADLYEKDF
jgi:hypothetical protein